MPKHAFPAAAEGMPNIDRRAAMAAFALLPAAVGAAILPIPAAQIPHHVELADQASDAQFIADLLEWRQAYDEGWDEEEGGSAFKRQIAILDRIIDKPASTAIAFAVQLLICTSYGEVIIAEEDMAALVSSAERVIGIPAPSSLEEWRRTHRQNGEGTERMREAELPQ